MQEKELKLISCFLNNWEVETVLAFQSGNDYGFSDAEYKPIVRPLSQLTQEIEHNGEKVVPLDWIWNNCQFLYDNVDYKELLVDSINLESITEWLPIKALNFLCECHFDLFNWIEKGLAIEKK